MLSLLCTGALFLASATELVFVAWCLLRRADRTLERVVRIGLPVWLTLTALWLVLR